MGFNCLFLFFIHANVYFRPKSAPLPWVAASATKRKLSWTSTTRKLLRRSAPRYFAPNFQHPFPDFTHPFPPDFSHLFPRLSLPYAVAEVVLAACAGAHPAPSRVRIPPLTNHQGQLPWKETLDVTLPHAGSLRLAASAAFELSLRALLPFQAPAL